MLRRLAIAATITLFAAPLGAQFAYPAFQPSRVADREYNFALSSLDGDATAFTVQWREGLGNPRMQLNLDAAIIDFDADIDAMILLGGGLTYQLARETADMPFDVAFTAGVGFGFQEDITILSIPIGVVAGHRFPLEGAMAITPYVHPRLSIDRYSIDTGVGDISDTETNLNIDIGGNLEINPRMAIRLALSLGDADAVGLSFAWTPGGLRR